MEDLWHSVEHFLTDHLVPEDEHLQHALQTSQEAELPPINVSGTEGRLLYLLTKLTGARKVLEIGTLGGYSALCFAKAVPDDGLVITLEFEKKHAEVAQHNVDFAGLSHKVRVLHGAALETLPRLAQEAPFDVVFIDADKVNNLNYLGYAVKYARPGTLIILDNVVRGGTLVDQGSADPNVWAIRDTLDAIKNHPGLEATALQTVGLKGHDGFALVRVK